MQKVTIISVGHLKENYLRDACGEYIKRLSSYCALTIVELDPEKIPEKPSTLQIQNVIEKECKKILNKIPNSAMIISMCIEGKLLSSPQLAQKTESSAIDGFSNICFIIGGSYGLSKEVKDISHLKLSMSPMTFPHQLARVMLLEQVYRSYKIIEGSSYHK